jgi:hypothetical protein
MKTGVSYFGNRIPKHVKEDMKEIKKYSCDFVVHTFSENDMQFYKETMKKIVAASHEAGLDVWLSPWRVLGIFGGEAYSRSVVDNSDIRQKDNKGIALPALCPNKRHTRNFIKKWIDAAAEVNADYVMWDEPHFFAQPKDKPKRWSCMCLRCRSLFKKRYGNEMPKKYSDKVHDFREHSIKNFLSDVCAYAKNKGLKNSVVLTIWQMNRAEHIFKNKDIEIIGTDPYWGYKGRDCTADLDVNYFVKRYADILTELSKKYNKKVMGWVQAFKIKQGTEADVAAAIRIFGKNKTNYIAAWGFNGCGHMSYLKCDNPEKVWSIIGKEYKKLKK